MNLRFKLLALLCVVLTAFAFAGPDAKKISLGRVAQATAPTRVYSRPSTRARVLNNLQTNEYLVVRDYKKGSPWKLVLMKNGTYAYGRSETMNVLNYEYKVDAPPESAMMASMPRATSFSSRGNEDLRAAVAQYALNFKGTPYVWGGNNLQSGIDCSGFVKQLYGQIGMNLPRTAAEQVNVGSRVARLEDLRKGDRLYFWDANRNCVGHTGIYLGNGMFVHSSRTHRGVDTDDLHNPKWMRILVAARR
jgi:cell wall-associated NlpC family hydrolase